SLTLTQVAGNVPLYTAESLTWTLIHEAADIASTLVQTTRSQAQTKGEGKRPMRVREKEDEANSEETREEDKYENEDNSDDGLASSSDSGAFDAGHRDGPVVASDDELNSLNFKFEFIIFVFSF
ncbi:hypothetical protein AMTR_s00163p00063920, partial [Amborella trichopoda]